MFGITATEGFQFGGQAISDLFGAAGDQAEANAYNQAATYALENEQYEKESTAIQQSQLQRKVFQTTGAQVSGYAGGNLALQGTARDVYSNSMAQGSLAHALLQVQGQINENSYAEAASQYQGMAQAAKAAAGGGLFGGLLSGAASILGFLSDDSAKQNIIRVGPSHVPGIDYYLFQYRGDDTVFKGVLASQVRIRHPEALHYDEGSGLYRVDYDRLGLKMETIDGR